WPMPAYDWAANAASGYEWWLRRLQREQRFADVVRIDHFRAFADWWSVPAGEPSSAGRWELGPGAAFFELVRERLGALRIVVEDLGAETEPLQQLRRETGLPQMRVLVQGLDEDPSSPHLPDAWNGPEAAYTDTHDFDTIAGWASRASEERLAFAFELTGTDTIEDLPRAAIELVADSRARYAIAPLQDWLELGSDARMNVPGTAVGNWRWIAPAGAFSETLAEEMAAVATWSLRGGAE
ncbi:MAG: 4-alpha-glucanotransferase, partial [Gaiellales bacterium]